MGILKQRLTRCFTILLIAIALMGTCSRLFAEDVSFEATLSANNVVLGTAIDLALTVHGTQDVSEIALPPIDGFQVRFLGPSTQISVVNGAYTSLKTFNYELLPVKSGKLTIPSFEIQIKGANYRTSPLIVDVTVGAASSGGGSSGASGGSQEELSNQIKLLVILPRTKIYVGEELPVIVRLYVRNVSLDDIAMPQIDTPGIEFGAFAQPRQGEETVEGVKFQVVEFRTVLSASRPGVLSVGPVRLQASQVYKTAQNRGGVFDDDFFRGFFGGYQKRAIMLTSNPFELNVLELPQEGRPENFSGAVGTYDFKFEASPAEVKVGDPVTLKMSLSGEGSFKGIKFPQFAGDGFKIYDSKIHEESGHKMLEQVIMPNREDVREVPSVSFSSFDPVTAQYITVARGPFPLKVTPPVTGEEFHVASQESVAQDVLGQDIVFIKDHLGAVHFGAHAGRGGLIYWFVLVCYSLAWGLCLFFLAYRRKLKRDTTFARRKRAPVIARQALGEAEKVLRSGDVSRFYGVLNRILSDYFIQMFALNSGEIGNDAFWSNVRGNGIDDRQLSDVRNIFECADLARFAGKSFSKEQMDHDLVVARQIVNDLERRVK